ncbi:hypothetical protein [Streptomyces anulatus]|uniref:Uncharacterized protein n=1 Tax=Streptomyces anulatus TaxID=1892 RepID=A0A7K3R595_STRAQ|nr:hypothetical protein [Streptomyces anulatus]NEB97339.1 hypothetical protein [Streptomyces anulatus]NED26433.1 hypothetical protein [Streptomyces anulatus]
MSDRAWDRKQRLTEGLLKGAGLETGLARGPYGVAAESAAATSAGTAARTWSRGT